MNDFYNLVHHIVEAEDDQSGELVIRVSNLHNNQAKQFIRLLRHIEGLGRVGASREVRLFIDGDGAFRARFEIDQEDPENLELDTDSDTVTFGFD